MLQRSICESVMGGLDTDCNGATTGSIVGAAAGHSTFNRRLLAPLNNTIRPRVLGFAETKISELAQRQLEVFKKVRAYAQAR